MRRVCRELGAHPPPAAAFLHSEAETERSNISQSSDRTALDYSGPGSQSYSDFVLSLLQLQQQLLCVESSSLHLLLQQAAPPAPLLSQLRVGLGLQTLQLLTQVAVFFSELLQEEKDKPPSRESLS